MEQDRATLCGPRSTRDRNGQAGRGHRAERGHTGRPSSADDLPARPSTSMWGLSTTNGFALDMRELTNFAVRRRFVS